MTNIKTIGKWWYYVEPINKFVVAGDKLLRPEPRNVSVYYNQETDKFHFNFGASPTGIIERELLTAMVVESALLKDRVPEPVELDCTIIRQ